MLQIEDVSLSLNGEPILQGVSLKISRGEIHAILGVNGTGKSTLAYLLMGLDGYRPTSGRIIFENKDITDLSISERAKLGVTMAWQEPARFEGLTVREYLQLSQGIEGGPHSPTACLEKVGLDPSLYLGRPVDQSLSGGERKRVELASVLAMKPKLAILDEPDSGIDAPSLKQVIEVIRILTKERSSVILITHQERVARVADRATCLCAGKVLRTGSSEEMARFFSIHCETCSHINEPEEELIKNV